MSRERQKTKKQTTNTQAAGAGVECDACDCCGRLRAVRAIVLAQSLALGITARKGMWNVCSQYDSPGGSLVGLRAARVFDGERIEGIISASWTREGDGSPSVWHMLHADLFDEDLSLEETRAAVDFARTTRSAQPALRDCDDTPADAPASARARARR